MIRVDEFGLGYRNLSQTTANHNRLYKARSSTARRVCFLSNVSTTIAHSTCPFECVPMSTFASSEQQRCLERVLHDSFETNAGRVAINDPSTARRLTYAQLGTELSLRANQLAEIGQGTLTLTAPRAAAPRRRLVALLFRDGVELVVSLLSCLSAGIPFIVLDEQWPKERLAFIVTQSGAELCLTDDDDDLTRAATSPLTMHGLQVVHVEKMQGNGRPSVVNGHLFGKRATTGGFELAYMNFTSGSTGRPKGIAHSWTELSTNILFNIQNIGLASAANPTNFLQLIPFFSDPALRQLLLPLCTGGTVTLLASSAQGSGAAGNVSEWSALMRRERVTDLHIVPSLLVPFVELVETAGDSGAASNRMALQRVYTIGELKRNQGLRALRARSTALHFDDSSSESEDVSSFVVPRKKKASRVGSITTSEVYAGVLSQASKTSTTLGGRSQSSQLQPHGEVSQSETSRQNPKSTIKATALNRKQSSSRSVVLGNIVEDESSLLEIHIPLSGDGDNMEPLISTQADVDDVHEDSDGGNAADVEPPLDTNQEENEEEQDASDSEHSALAEAEAVAMLNKTNAQEKRMSVSRVSHERTTTKTTNKSRTSILGGFGGNADDSDSDSEPEVLRRMSVSRKKPKHAPVKVTLRRSLGRGRQSKSNTRRSEVVVEEVIDSDLSDLENLDEGQGDGQGQGDEHNAQVSDPNQEHSSSGDEAEASNAGAGQPSRHQSILDKNNVSKPRPSMAAGGPAQHLTPVNKVRQHSAQESFDALRTSIAEVEGGTNATGAGPSRRIAHPGATAAPKKVLEKRVKADVDEADWNETRESALVAAKKRKKMAKITDLRSNANMISKEKIAGFHMAMGEELSKTELNRVHTVANTMIEKFLDKLCASTPNPNGMFSYKELEEALKAQGSISGKKNILALEFATAFTPEKLHKMMGVLIPSPGEDDTHLDHLYD